MNNHDSLSLDHVSKKFAKNLNSSMKYGILDIAKDIFHVKNKSDKLRESEFWALRNISFHISRGEILGIIGSNGAGKSTLLKLINGIFLPDTGRISINGRIGALIELGAGFHPMLTGRENIYVNAAILGIPRKEVDKKLDDIIEFSGIGSFIDTPVKFYSSGMHARLGFSVAAHMDTDILLVDEVLAVGDAEFQRKCMNHMVHLIKSDKAVIIISHSVYLIESLCNKVVWIENGEVVSIGLTQKVIRQYLDFQEKKMLKGNKDKSSLQRDAKKLLIEKVEITTDSNENNSAIPFGKPVAIKIHYNAQEPIHKPHFNIRILLNGNDILEAGMNIDGSGPKCIEGCGMVECNFPYLPLTPKVYDLLLWVSNDVGTVYLSDPSIVLRFRITDDNIDWNNYKGAMSINHMRQGSPVYMKHKWTFYDSSTHEISEAIDVSYY